MFYGMPFVGDYINFWPIQFLKKKWAVLKRDQKFRACSFLPKNFWPVHFCPKISGPSIFAQKFLARPFLPKNVSPVLIYAPCTEFQRNLNKIKRT